jgi:predicted kinase
MSGLPAAGKDHWIAANRPGWAVVSLDALRAELGVDPGGDQGPVVEAAYRLAREHLRAGRPYVWNATNLTRQLRDRCIGLAAGYGARIDLVSLEAPPHALRPATAPAPGRYPTRSSNACSADGRPPTRPRAHHVVWIPTA